MSTKLFVGNISENCMAHDLRAHFEQYGEVLECDIVRDYAFVHFAKKEEAIEAVNAINNTEFHGSRIRVEMSNSKVRQKAGMGDVEGCYKCGQPGHKSRTCPTDSHSGRGGGYRGRGRGYGMSDRGGRGRGRGSHDYRPYPPSRAAADPYYSGHERYRSYADHYSRYPHPRSDPYAYEPAPPSDPYSRPPPDYYRFKRTGSPPARDPYASSAAAAGSRSLGSSAASLGGGGGSGVTSGSLLSNPSALESKLLDALEGLQQQGVLSARGSSVLSSRRAPISGGPTSQSAQLGGVAGAVGVASGAAYHQSHASALTGSAQIPGNPGTLF